MSEKEEYSELLRTLVKRLRNVCDEENFVVGVLSCVWENEEDQQAVIDFIDAGDDVDYETVTVLALDLSDARDALEGRVTNEYYD